MMKRSAQVSVEFLIFVGISFLIAIIIVSMAVEQQSEKVQERGMVELQDIANKIQEEVMLAQTVESGYARTFYLADRLPSGLQYSITQNSSYITVSADTRSIEILVPPYEGLVMKGDNLICNRGGRVFLGGGCFS